MQQLVYVCILQMSLCKVPAINAAPQIIIFCYSYATDLIFLNK